MGAGHLYVPQTYVHLNVASNRRKVSLTNLMLDGRARHEPVRFDGSDRFEPINENRIGSRIEPIVFDPNRPLFGSIRLKTDKTVTEPKSVRIYFFYAIYLTD